MGFLTKNTTTSAYEVKNSTTASFVPETVIGSERRLEAFGRRLTEGGSQRILEALQTESHWVYEPAN